MFAEDKSFLPTKSLTTPTLNIHSTPTQPAPTLPIPGILAICYPTHRHKLLDHVSNLHKNRRRGTRGER